MARRKYSVDEALIARNLKEGRGTGFGVDYKPWLKIYDVPSLGRSHRLRGIKTGRVHHFLSDIEVNLFYLLDWHDAVTDIREQFPLDREETQAIAERAGIRYPYLTAFLPEEVRLAVHDALFLGHAEWVTVLLGLAATRVQGAKTLRYCPACRSEMLAQHGELYWRRDHQLPGVTV